MRFNKRKWLKLQEEFAWADGILRYNSRQYSLRAPPKRRPLPSLSDYIDWSLIADRDLTDRRKRSRPRGSRKLKMDSENEDVLELIKKRLGPELFGKVTAKQKGARSEVQRKVSGPPGATKPPRKSDFLKKQTSRDSGVAGSSKQTPAASALTSSKSFAEKVKNFSWDSSKDRNYLELVAKMDRRMKAVNEIQKWNLTEEMVATIAQKAISSGKNASIPTNPTNLKRFMERLEAFRKVTNLEIEQEDYSLLVQTCPVKTKPYLEDLGIPENFEIGEYVISNRSEAEGYYREKWAKSMLKMLRSKAGQAQAELAAKHKAEQNKLQADWEPRFRNFFREWPDLKPPTEDWAAFLGAEDPEEGKLATAEGGNPPPGRNEDSDEKSENEDERNPWDAFVNSGS